MSKLVNCVLMESMCYVWIHGIQNATVCTKHIQPNLLPPKVMHVTKVF